MEAIFSFIPGAWLAFIGAAIAGLGAIIWRVYAAGKNAERAKQDRERVKANAREMDRLDGANKARLDAEHRARGGELRDDWSRD